VELGEALVFIDALVPEAADDFWRWADARATERAVFVVTTLSFHRRSRELIADRYEGSTSRAASSLPAGIEAKPLRGAREVAFWLEPYRALVFGDRILGDGAGGLRLCPKSWLGYLGIGLPQLRELVRPLLELPVERVIVSHGEPVVDDARAALERALS
jgi:hypothetical protein